MSGRTHKTRPPEQRSQANARFADRRNNAGIIVTVVAVPLSRYAEVRAIALAWRQEALTALDASTPTAEQIMRIHAVCRASGIALPVEAFGSHADANRWLIGREPRQPRPTTPRRNRHEDAP